MLQEQNTNAVLNSVMGLVVGDALGVPVEFVSREELAENPIESMQGYGTHKQKPGTWSDDSSLTLATLESLTQMGYNCNDMMLKFMCWYVYQEYTPYGEVFDVGKSTHKAIHRYLNGYKLEQCSSGTENDNGNGALMRILPVVLYGINNASGFKEFISMIERASAITHSHLQSKIACCIYGNLLKDILMFKNYKTKAELIEKSCKDIIEYYMSKESERINIELSKFNRIKCIKELSQAPEEQINSKGYVISTLEAAIWCFYNTETYKDCLLKAVNLGNDTDTIGAVAGSLAGAYYGYRKIPREWIQKIARKDWIKELCNRFAKTYQYTQYTTQKSEKSSY